MQEANKVCPVHGELKKGQYSVEKSKKCQYAITVRCKLCRIITRLKALGVPYFSCEVHGELNDNEVYFKSNDEFGCKICVYGFAGSRRDSDRKWFNDKIAEDKRNNPEKWDEYYKKEYSRKKLKYGVLLSLHKVCQSRGITIDDYNRMLKEQNGKCQICKKEETCKDPKHDRIRRLNIDHCHVTKKVRGLLCHSCNTALGKLKDDISLFESAINYLKEHKE